ncbi:membrane-spanning 4-domains subfamily A member 4A-like [Heterodontus francisci]|uniref:membrane-spanning 4-domains subfamily A member 4A-like n=1 Tax=Heterodontus francisci TaxID=7792 RepID=UPI00355C007C
MAYVVKNDRNVPVPIQLPPSQQFTSIPQLLQYVENGQLNQAIATNLIQNDSGVQEMLKGKFKALGITEIVTGIISIIIGIVQFSIGVGSFAFALLAGTPWWTGVLFIVAGSLAVAVERTPTHGMIRGCLSMNIISAIFCLPAIILYSINLAVQPYCYDMIDYDCYQTGAVVCMAILLLLALLNAAISISISSFNCKAMTCCRTTPAPVIVMYNNASAQPIPSLQFNANPPPYNMTLMENVYANAD